MEVDEKYMTQAINEARKALAEGEIPIGCVIVAGNQIVGRGHNLTETLQDVTAHAEIQAITAAAQTLGGKYLTDCSLYVTVEPCAMCAGAERLYHFCTEGTSPKNIGEIRYIRLRLPPINARLFC